MVALHDPQISQMFLLLSLSGVVVVAVAPFLLRVVHRVLIG